MRPSLPAIVTPLRLIALSSLLLLAACQYVTTPTPTTSTSTTTPASPTVGTTTLTYTTDVQPILASDCVRCHGPSNHQSGVDLSSYSAVLRTVTPGDANSLLILATAPGGFMNSQFSGNAAIKATTIYNWVVLSHAAQ